MNEWSWPTLVSIGGGGWSKLHMWKPALRSSIVSGSVSRSFSIAQSSLVFLALISQAVGFGHCSMCTVFSTPWLHHGQAADSCCPHLCIIWPVVQKPVVNLVVHHCCLIVILVTIICIIDQSMDLMSIPLNCVLLDQYALTACLQVCLISHCLTAVLIFSFSSHNSHGSPNKLCIIGSSCVCIFIQWFFAAWSIASFHLTLSLVSRAT